MKYVEKYSRGNTICKSAETEQWFAGMGLIWSLKARMYLGSVKMAGHYRSKLRGVWGKLSSSVSGLNLTCTHTHAAVTEEGKAGTGWDGRSESIFDYSDCEVKVSLIIQIVRYILICNVKVQTYPSSKSEASSGREVQENFLRRWSSKASSLLISSFLSFCSSFEREERQTRIQKSWRKIWRRSCSRRWSLPAREPDWSPPKIFHLEFFFSPSLLSSPFPGGRGWPSSTGGHNFFSKSESDPFLNIHLNLWVLKCHVIPCTCLNFCERTKERSELLSKQLQGLSNEKQERFWKLSDCKVDFLLVNSLPYHHLRISGDFPPCHFLTSGEGRTRGKTFNWRNLANK